MKALTTEATVYCAQTHNQKRINMAARHSGTVSAQAQINEHGRLNSVPLRLPGDTRCIVDKDFVRRVEGERKSYRSKENLLILS
jgi:hypothetical protein